MRHPMRKSLRNFLIIIIVCCLVLFSLEKSLNVSSYPITETLEADTEIVSYMRAESATQNELFATSVVEEKIDIKPNNVTEDKLYPLIQNTPTGNEYDEDTVNIVVFGDSFVWGPSCMNRNELFWRLVETELRKKGYNCRVFCVGFSAASAYDEFRWLTQTSLVNDLDPDLILFGYVYNDSDPSYSFDNSKYSLAHTDDKIPFSSFLRSVFPNLYIRLNNYVVAKTMYTDEQYEEYVYFLTEGSTMPIYITKGKLYEKYKNEFVIPLDNYAKQADFPIVYMTLPPSPSYTMLNALFKPVRELFSEYTNVAFYDCLNEPFFKFFSRKHAANYTLSSIDYHPGSATNRFYADYIVDFLEKDYPEVIGKSVGKDLNNYDILINDSLPGKIDLKQEAKTEKSVTYSLQYPSEISTHQWEEITIDPYLITYPLGKRYIKLSFAQPVDIKSVEITGDKVNNIELYYTKINENLNYDDHTIMPFGVLSSDGTVLNDSSKDKVTSLCVHADCIDNDGSEIRIVINK